MLGLEATSGDFHSLIYSFIPQMLWGSYYIGASELGMVGGLAWRYRSCPRGVRKAGMSWVWSEGKQWEFWKCQAVSQDTPSWPFFRKVPDGAGPTLREGPEEIPLASERMSRLLQMTATSLHANLWSQKSTRRQFMCRWMNPNGVRNWAPECQRERTFQHRLVRSPCFP